MRALRAIAMATVLLASPALLHEPVPAPAPAVARREVPEPDGWAMLFIGAAVVLLAGRRAQPVFK